MYFQGLILEIFFILCRIYWSQVISDLQKQVVRQYFSQASQNNLNALKEHDLRVSMAISCTKIKKMAMNLFPSQKRYWEGITSKYQACSVGPNPALHHGPETWCIPVSPCVLMVNFVIADIPSLVPQKMFRWAAKLVCTLLLKGVTQYSCLLPAYLFALFHLVRKSLNYEFES